MKFELFLAYMEHLTCVALIFLIAYAIAWIVCLINKLIAYPEVEIIKADAFYDKMMKTLPLGFCLIFLVMTPSINDLYKIRLGLLKYELTSPENVSKGTAEIQRIAHKLECKYLGCNEKKSDQKE